jgi:hypothetical protein
MGSPCAGQVSRWGLGWIHPSVPTAVVKAQNDYECWIIYFKLLLYLLSFNIYRQLTYFGWLFTRNASTFTMSSSGYLFLCYKLNISSRLLSFEQFRCLQFFCGEPSYR